MVYTYNDPSKKEIRQKLRRNLSQPEQVLWYHLRGSKMQNWKFRRQYGVGVYILDFYCPELRLGIEIDGDSHYSENGRQYDAKREQYLNAHHISILRFTNREVMTNIEGVLQIIRSYHP